MLFKYLDHSSQRFVRKLVLWFLGGRKKVCQSRNHIYYYYFMINLANGNFDV